MFKNYVIVALRSIQKKIIYTAINILGLSFGLAAAILIFLYVQHELSADKHHEHRDVIYRVGVELGIGGPPVTAAVSSSPLGPELTESFPEVHEYLRFLSLDILSPEILVEYEDVSIYQSGVLLTDSNFFDFFTHPVLYGDPSMALRHSNMAVLTQSSAEHLFGPGDPVGKTFRFNREHHIEVGGVIADIPDNVHLKFRFLMNWHSLGGHYREGLAASNYFQNNIFTYLKAGQPLNEPDFMAKADEFIYERAVSQFSEHGLEGTYKLHIRPMSSLYFQKGEQYEPVNPETIPAKGDRLYVIVLITVAVFLTGIAAINYTNIAIARSGMRSKEVGVRKVLGGERSGLVKQFLSESLLISFFAMVLALLWVWVVLPVFNNLLIKNLDMGLLLGPGFVLMMAGLVAGVGLLAGSYPALYLSGFRPLEVLKQQVSLSGSNMMVRKVLVGLQFTISVFMIIATLIVSQQLAFMRSKDLGYHKDHIVVLNITDLESTRRQSLKNEMEQLSAVESASLSFNVPGPGVMVQHWGFVAESEEGFSERMSSVYHVDPYFADLYNIGLSQGRFFDPDLPTDVEQSVVINEAAARMFGWNEPLGKQFRQIIEGDTIMRRVIGVVRDFHVTSLDHEISSLVIMPHLSGNRLNLRLNPGSSPSAALRSIEESWTEVAGYLPIRVQFLDETHRLAYLSHYNLGRLFALFALLCILLSLMGLFGLSGFTAEQKTREIGIRKVHGAETRHILLMLYKEYSMLMIFAVVVASALAWFFLDHWLSQFVFRTDIGLWPFLLAALLSFGVSLLTVGYHAAKSSGANPVDALKYE